MEAYLLEAYLDPTTTEGPLDSPVLVINLPCSRQRRDAISRQLHLRKIDFEIVDGILIESEQVPLWTKYRPWRSLIVKGRELSHGEIGCYVSHLKAIQRIYAAGWPHAIVLEDDAIVQSGFSGIVRESIPQLARFEVVKFESNECSKHFRATGVVSRHCTLGFYLGGSYGTAGYLVSRQGARKLLRHLQTPVVPFDDALDGELQSAFRVACWRPSPVVQTRDQSDIWDQTGTHEASLRESRGLMRRLNKLYARYARRRRWRAYQRIQPCSSSDLQSISDLAPHRHLSAADSP